MCACLSAGLSLSVCFSFSLALALSVSLNLLEERVTVIVCRNAQAKSFDLCLFAVVTTCSEECLPSFICSDQVFTTPLKRTRGL